MQIPGTYSLTSKGTIPESLLLLTGPVGAGKTIYCRQFIIDGLYDGDYCIYVSSSLTDKQFRTHFSNVENLNLYKNCKFINPYLCKGHLGNRDLSSITRLEKSEGSYNKLLLTLG
jgi:archaellum biogenesis ATPase FlaH